MEHLEYFISLAQAGSTTKASTELFTTHQNVSKMIGQLEDELDATLFIRSKKGVALTPAGHIMLDYARLATSELAKTKQALDTLRMDATLKGDLHLYTGIIPLNTALPNIVRDFSAYYPDIRLHILEDDANAALCQIALHDNVLGLIPLLSNEQFKGIYAPYLDQVQCYPLLEDSFICTINDQSPLAKKKSISMFDFIKEPIGLRQDSQTFSRLLECFGEPNIAFSSNNRDLYVQAVTSGRCAGISSLCNFQRKDAGERYQHMVMLPFEEDLQLNICLVNRKQVKLSPLSQAFVDFVHRKYLPLS